MGFGFSGLAIPTDITRKRRVSPYEADSRPSTGIEQFVSPDMTLPNRFPQTQITEDDIRARIRGERQGYGPQEATGVVGVSPGYAPPEPQYGMAGMAAALPQATVTIPQAQQTMQQMSTAQAMQGTPQQQQGAVNNQIRATYGDAMADTFLPGQRTQELDTRRAQMAQPDLRQRSGWGKVGHVLISGLKGFASGARHGGGFGGLGGLVAGMANPRAAERGFFRDYQEPEMQSRAQEEQQNKARQFQGLAGLANMTGRLPGGDLTEGAKERQARLAETTWNHRQVDADRDARQAEAARQHKEEMAKNAVTLAAKLRRPVDPNAVKDTSLASFANAVPPPDMAEIDRVVDTFGKFNVPVPGEIVKGTPYAPIAGKTPPVKPDYEAVRLARDAARDARMEERDRQKDEKDAETRYNTVQDNVKRADKELAKAQGAYRAAQADKKREAELPYFEEQVRQARADSERARYEAQQAAERLKTEHGWNVTVDKDGYSDAKKPAKPRATTGGGRRNPVRREASAADIDGFAKEYFGGDKLKAEAYLKQQGYTIH